MERRHPAGKRRVRRGSDWNAGTLAGNAVCGVEHM